MGLEQARETVRACRYCFMCRYACPTFLATKRESVTSRGYALMLMMIDTGQQAWSRDIVRTFYQCSLCGLGKADCEYDWPEDEMVRHARAEIVAQGLAPEGVEAVAATLQANGQPWAEAMDLPAGKQNPEVLYLAGCQARARNPEIVAATARVLSGLGVNWSVLAEETCCGGGLYDLGYTAQAKHKARELADQIDAANPKMVVTGCAHCYRSLKEFYPEWGLTPLEGIEILHISEYLHRAAAAGKLKLDGRPGAGSLGYHDPCMLGRKMGIYDAPRQLLESATGQAPVELWHNKELAECCGAGAATFLTEPGVARQVAGVRLERAREAGARLLVTACQNCKTLLVDAAEDNRDEVRVMDLVEVVAQHMV